MSQAYPLSQKIKTYRQETQELKMQIDRLERWIHEIAKQTGVKLSEA